MTKPTPQGLRAQVQFVKPDNRMGHLGALQLGDCGAARVRFKAHELYGTLVAAAELRATAEALSAAEAQALGEGLSDEALLSIPLTAYDEGHLERHVITELYLDERSTLEAWEKEGTRRQSHTWVVYLEDGALWLHFDHGLYGLRRERHGRWSQAVARLAELLAGECTWLQFGDAQSQRTWLEKGQFYWRDAQADRLVPVDNFIYVSPSSAQLCLEGVSRRCVLAYREPKPSPRQAFEWHADYAHGLRRMADMLDGLVTLEQFGVNSHDDEEPDSSKPRGVVQAGGGFVVRCIYADNDTLRADELVFQTAQGHQAWLCRTSTGWTVAACNPTGGRAERTFAATELAPALRSLASVLDGTVAWPEFEPGSNDVA